MNYEQIQKLIAENAHPDAWLHFDGSNPSWTLKADLLVTIHCQDDEDEPAVCEEDWAKKHPNPGAIIRKYRLYYGNSLVEEQCLVSVDGHRADLPFPDVDGVISAKSYRFARCVDFQGRLDEYIKRSGLKHG
jgi:hypothetical protein